MFRLVAIIAIFCLLTTSSVVVVSAQQANDQSRELQKMMEALLAANPNIEVLRSDSSQKVQREESSDRGKQRSRIRIQQKDDRDASSSDRRRKSREMSSQIRAMKLFLLRYREAAAAKSQLERYLDMSGGGGGGGGGMTGMMGNFMQNALPGAAGGMANAQLAGGGGSSSGGSIRELAGDVTIVADAKQYSLLVSALPEDMDLVAQLVDMIDQPTATRNHVSNGRTERIEIKYIDPETLETMVRANLAAVLRNPDEANGQYRGNAEARMQQQMLRSLLGRYSGGGGGAEEQESPKATLSVDTRNRMLVVTGPEFIVDQVRDFVRLVDTPVITPPSANELVSPGDLNSALLDRDDDSDRARDRISKRSRPGDRSRRSPRSRRGDSDDRGPRGKHRRRGKDSHPGDRSRSRRGPRHARGQERGRNRGSARHARRGEHPRSQRQGARSRSTRSREAGGSAKELEARLSKLEKRLTQMEKGIKAAGKKWDARLERIEKALKQKRK